MATVTQEDKLACIGRFPVYGYSAEARRIENDIVVFCHSVQINVTVTSRVRTCEQQAALYRTGQSTAAPGTSQHEFGFAFDIVPTSGYQRYGATRAQAMAWLGALAQYFGAGQALNEGDHMHVALYSNEAWRNFILSRDVGSSVPIPSRRPRGR